MVVNTKKGPDATQAKGSGGCQKLSFSKDTKFVTLNNGEVMSGVLGTLGLKWLKFLQ